ncbi:MAG: hypothetical protein KIT84_04550 [Labilithrix sp.]|nr:hypothetical protein [Labilithrix sp.]MCW5810256.1 hypothetical protein [Labilithrix sp.]
MLVRRLAWLAVIPAITLAVATCDDATTASDGPPDSGTNPGVLDQGKCPDAAPLPGATCSVPEGTTCRFDECSLSIAQCTRGTWRFGARPPSVLCPTRFPTPGEACPACFSAEAECVYGSLDCSAPDASVNRSRARCPSGTWEVTTEPCADAGSDVQGDAAPDSD